MKIEPVELDRQYLICGYIQRMQCTFTVYESLASSVVVRGENYMDDGLYPYLNYLALYFMKPPISNDIMIKTIMN